MTGKKNKVEFRYYNMKEGTYSFALLGDSWIREYGIDIDCLHFHNYLEIGICRFGEGEMEFGEEIREYHPGCITVIPKNFPHTTNSKPGTKSHWEYLFVDADNFIADSFPSGRDAEKILNSVNQGVFYFHEDEYPEVARNIKAIMEVYRKRDSYYNEEVEGLLKVLFIRIARETNKNSIEFDLSQNMNNNSSTTILKALEYIEEHYSEDIKIGNLADACYISETHLRRLFQEYLRMGVLDYINMVRIHKACEIMRKTDEKVSTIAYDCGFNSLTTFNRNFKELLKMNPGEWRNQPENYEQMLLRSFVHFEEGW